MKIPIQYLNDEEGNVKAVQVPYSDWKKLLDKLKKYEQALQLKSELKEALDQATRLSGSKKRKQTLNEFLNEI
ncbi:MAG: hypothetical protein ABIQ02_14425 [Saprospiraceae bacterium]